MLCLTRCLPTPTNMLCLRAPHPPLLSPASSTEAAKASAAAAVSAGQKVLHDSKTVVLGGNAGSLGTGKLGGRFGTAAGTGK